MHENTETRREVQNTSCLMGQQSRYIVIPAGVRFFHITERSTGRVKGFRRRLQDACELARQLER